MQLLINNFQESFCLNKKREVENDRAGRIIKGQVNLNNNHYFFLTKSDLPFFMFFERKRDDFP